MAKGMKAFRIDKEGQLRFLFHAYKAPGGRASSLVPFDCWIETKRPWGSEGKRKKKYRLAFHFLRDPERIENFQKLTRGKYVLIPISVSDIEPKPRSSVGSWLARRIRVDSDEVKKALSSKAI
jgi:hypothetical protein